MSIKVKEPGKWINGWFTTVLEFIPDPTCFNEEGIEHFGVSCKNCGCESCKRIRGEV